jgi:hypothetical protein
MSPGIVGDGSVYTCKHLMRVKGPEECVFCHRDQLKDLIDRALEWEPVFPLEASLIDEMWSAIGKKKPRSLLGDSSVTVPAGEVMDLVTRLRYRSSTDLYPRDTALTLMTEAADEIERQRHDIEQLQKAASAEATEVEGLRMILRIIGGKAWCPESWKDDIERVITAEPQ